jgi:U6 snRNA-associated Sm-like protein LSm4
MLPMQLLSGAIDTPVSIEVKSGECYNGLVVKADYFMNFLLKDVTITSPDGQEFSKVPSCYVRGNSVKYIRVSEEASEKAVIAKQNSKRGRGGYRGRGRRP